QPQIIAVPGFSSKRESKSGKMKSQARRLYEMRAKWMKYFWIALVTMMGLSAGWMMGQSWISSPQVPTRIAEIVPSANAKDATESKQSSKEQSSEEKAVLSAPSDQTDQEAQF